MNKSDEPVEAFFRADRISVSFGGLRALADVSFQVKKGDVHAIIGPNGAGKTTMFNCISGIYKPDAGEIRFLGERIDGRKPDRVARLGIARTFQNIELFKHMNAMDNIMLGRHIFMKTGLFHGVFMWGRRSFAGREEREHRGKVEEIIDFLDLQAVRNRSVGGLPYGTQKMVELGRALALEPRLLLLDEPCAGMTAEEKQDLAFKIEDIKEELGITVLLIEHDMGMVMEISDRVLVVDFGSVVAEGPPEEVQKDPEVLRAYLGDE